VVPAVLVSALCGLLFGRVWVLAAIGQRPARRLDRQTAELRHALHEQSVLQDQLTYRAGHDTRTGLANRDLCAERLAAAGDGHAVVLCGLDGFKAVNDAYGHGVGDEVLRRLAGRLRACAGPGDLAARLGGDEFGVLVAGGRRMPGGGPKARPARPVCDGQRLQPPVAGAVLHQHRAQRA
jgi:GGDEF domain-containing protein